MTSSRSILSHPDFRRLWIADLLSQLGARLSMIAIPLLAVLTLDATTFQVSLLRDCCSRTSSCLATRSWPPTTLSAQLSVRAQAAYWSSGSVPR
jgi:hypothetical protein